MMRKGEGGKRENEIVRVQRGKEGILGSGGEDRSDHHKHIVVNKGMKTKNQVFVLFLRRRKNN